MSKRGLRGVVAGNIAEAPHKLSDKSARLWESYYGPMNGAVAGLNNAIQNVQNILGRIIMAQEGKDPDTHLFDADRMVIIRRPTPPVENGNG